MNSGIQGGFFETSQFKTYLHHPGPLCGSADSVIHRPRRLGSTMQKKIHCVTRQRAAPILLLYFVRSKAILYYFNADGTVHTGWLDLKGDRYFFSESGAMLTSQWIGDKYLMKNGKMARSRWVDNHNVYVNKTVPRGSRQKYKAKFIKTAQGTKIPECGWHLPAKTCKASKDTGTTFYSTGYMATNAQLGEYYVDKSSHMVKNKIVKIGKYYYPLWCGRKICKTFQDKVQTDSKKETFQKAPL